MSALVRWMVTRVAAIVIRMSGEEGAVGNF